MKWPKRAVNSEMSHELVDFFAAFKFNSGAVFARLMQDLFIPRMNLIYASVLQVCCSQKHPLNQLFVSVHTHFILSILTGCEHICN